MKKILILGLIFAAVGCSNEPELNMDEINKAAALAMLKGSYKTTVNTPDRKSTRLNSSHRL